MGSKVGSDVGFDVGECDGSKVGSAVGFELGNFVGAGIGIGVLLPATPHRQKSQTSTLDCSPWFLRCNLGFGGEKKYILRQSIDHSCTN